MFPRCSNTIKANNSRVRYAGRRVTRTRRVTQQDVAEKVVSIEVDSHDVFAESAEVHLYQHAKLLRHHGSIDYAADYIKGIKALTPEQLAAKEKIFQKFQGENEKIFGTEGNLFNIERTIYDAQAKVYNEELNPPVRVAVTGAAGQIGYALLFRIASGAMFGPKTPVILQLLDIPEAQDALQGVIMELKDCAYPLVAGIKASSVAEEAFEGVDYALLVGASPRGPGMERKDLLQANGKIFVAQGDALNKVGKAADTRVVVVGNPANTNALIASNSAPTIPASNFAAMTKLDHNRGLSQLANKIGCKTTDINRFVIWGNHSATQYPDIFHATVGDKLVTDLVDDAWYNNTFIPSVQQRGAAIIKARGLSSAASAASALCDNVREWHLGTSSNWTSVAVSSNGEYGVTPGLFYSYPVVYQDGQYSVVDGLPITEASAKLMEATHQELLEERDAVADLLK